MVATAEEIMRSFEETFGDGIEEMKLEYYRDGVKKTPAPKLWIRMHRQHFHDAVKHLSEIGYIHNSVASGSDIGELIEILYHLTVFFEEEGKEVTVSIGIRVPKDDPVYPTITDVVPGAVTTEREKQEFLGVLIDGIPDPRKMFLLESNIPDDIYPWRKDEHSPERLVRRVHEFDKPADSGGGD